MRTISAESRDGSATFLAQSFMALGSATLLAQSFMALSSATLLAQSFAD